LAVAGRLLPALGFAVLLNQMVAERWTISLFILGWVVMTALEITITSLLLIAIAIALLFAMAADRSGSFNLAGNEDVIIDGGDDDDEYEE